MVSVEIRGKGYGGEEEVYIHGIVGMDLGLTLEKRLHKGPKYHLVYYTV